MARKKNEIRLYHDVHFWLDSEGISLWVGEETQPRTLVPLSYLLKQEVLMYALPATAKHYKDIERLEDPDGFLTELRDNLQAAADKLTEVIKKSDSNPS